MTLNSLRPQAEKLMMPLVKALERMGVAPNLLSIASLISAVLAGVFFYYSFSKTFLFLAALMVLLNAFFDATDGALATLIGATKKGDFLDHVLDRYSDTFIICGIFFGGYAPWQVGVVAIIGVLLTSYMGTQAQALDIGRYYGGILGRADRLMMIFLATIANLVYTNEIYGMSILGWMLVIVAITSHLTAIQRFAHVWKKLSKK
ncbi:MAG: CDP-alcohol phosphatidyltransferase family protein [Methanocellales archaeon]|nr:CDP-alcohol phosphatidyltransferase family protein [Methanocellales archaeon]